MNGTTHKAIGAATGVMIAAYGISKGIDLSLLAVVAAPFGAMLPDIDHDRTVMGRKRKKVTDTLKVVIPVVVIAFIALIVMEYIKSKNLAEAITKVLVILLPIAILVVLSKIPAVKKQWDFATKHRGFMHTLIIPIFMIIVTAFKFDSPILQWIVIGFTGGYLSHLFADSITTEKAPLLWPITRKTVGIPLVSTTNNSEKVAGFIIVVLEVLIAITFLVGFENVLSLIKN